MAGRIDKTAEQKPAELEKRVAELERVWFLLKGELHS